MSDIKFAQMVVFRSPDPNAGPEEWVPLKLEDVPRDINQLEIMGRLRDGEIAQPPGSEFWYRAEAFDG